MKWRLAIDIANFLASSGQQVHAQFPSYLRTRGLTLEGLQHAYASGVGDVDVDFAALGLTLKSNHKVSWLPILCC